MKWSQLSGRQRAFLANGASYERDLVKNGKVQRRGDPKGLVFDKFALERTKVDARAASIETCKLVERDADRARDKSYRESNKALIEAYTGAVVKCPDGRARNAGYLHRRTARALPMGETARLVG